MKNAATPYSRDERGQALMIILVIAAIGTLFITGFAGWAVLNVRAVRQTKNRELAMLIAESGAEYYRWHLAHYPADFQDGTGAAGPYVHPYKDKSGTTIGSFTLDITPPASGSTVVTVKSTGKVVADANVKRIVEVRLAKPSLAKYAVVANAAMRFGAGTEIFGQVHSNGGIHFDGIVAHNIMTSAVSDYDDPDHAGANEFGVHTHNAPVDPLPPAAVPNRPDVFEAGRDFPVPAVDFAGITADLASMKADSQANGRYFAASGVLGYHVVLKTNDTFDLYKVTALTSPPGGCWNSAGQANWGTWSIQSQTLLGNYANPTNGILFLEDNLWVDGQISTARLTIAVATFPENPATYKSITVNHDLKYSYYDGQDVLAMISQGDFNVGLVSDDTYRIDGAIMAQNGRAGRYYYRAGCGANFTRTALTLYGMIGTNARYGFAYTDGTGYTNRTLIYDAHLLYAPPPEFPLTSGQYVLISWQEKPN